MSDGLDIDDLFKNVLGTLSTSVLVVDDSPTMRKIIVRTLGRIGEFQCVEAGNGLEALRLLPTISARLIISDWNMPEMNGLDFVRAVRACESYREIPILMITTVNQTKDVFDAVKSGVNGYLTKPFKEEELEAKVRKLMQYT